MGVDVFICGQCQQVFHTLDQFVDHKNVGCMEDNKADQIILADSKTEPGMDTEMKLKNEEIESSASQVDLVRSEDDERVRPTSIVGRQEIKLVDFVNTAASKPTEVNSAGGGGELTVAADSGDLLTADNNDQLIQHVVELHDENGQPQRLQIQTAPGQNISIEDILQAFQHGKGLMQESSGQETEIQLIVPPDMSGPLQMVNLDNPAEEAKPVRRRGRPKKGQEKTKLPVMKTVQEEIQSRPTPEIGPDGKLTCSKCKKKFSKERHFNTHKCMALTDYVDVTGKEAINLEDDDEDEKEIEDKDADFRVQMPTKRRKIVVSNTCKAMDIRLMLQAENSVLSESPKEKIPENYKDTVPVEKKKETQSSQQITETSEKVQSSENDLEQPIEKAIAAAIGGADGTSIEQSLEETVGGATLEEVTDLAKEGLADFPGAGEIKLSEIRVDDGTEDPKLRDPLGDIIVRQDDKENQKSRRGRRSKSEKVEKVPSKEVKNMPIFKTEEERLEFEKSVNIDLSGVDSLFRIHVIDQDLTDESQALKTRVASKLTVFSCTVCEKIIMSQSHARLHCLTHTDLKPYKCFKCDYATNTKGNLYSHMRKHTGQLYKCRVCSFTTVNRGHLIEHEAIHSNVRIQCNICRKDYSTVKSLIGHVRRKHTSPKGKEYLERLLGHPPRTNTAVLHQCHICYRKFKKKVDRDRHMYIHDVKDNPNVYTCEICERVCSRRTYLEKHLTRHRIIYFCSECDRKFPSTVYLAHHLSSEHFKQADDDFLQQKFESCVENSLFLPEADGSLNFAEPEEGGNVNSDNAEAEESELNKSSGEVTNIDLQQDKATSGAAVNENEGSSRHLIQNSEDATGETLQQNNENLSRTGSNSEQIVDATNHVTGNHDNTTNDLNNESTEAESGRSDEETETETENLKKKKYNKEFFTGVGYESLTMDILSKIRNVFGKQECEYCGRLYYSIPDYEQHLRSHTGERPFSCNQCSYCASSKENLKRHIEREHDKLQFVCNQCGHTSANRSALWTHITQTHKAPVTYPCSLCDKQFTQFKHLKAHLQLTHNKEPEPGDVVAQSTNNTKPKAKLGRRCYKCPHCDRGIFKNAHDLQKHIWIHEGVKPFKCPLCPHACRSRNNLNSHMIRHSIDKPFLCNQCGKSYKSQTALRCHVKSHKDGKFKCGKCSYEATQLCHLKRHMETHDLLKRYVCQHCSYSANTLAYLKVHYTRHHKGKQAPNISALTNRIPMMRAAPEVDTKIYRCLSCDYLFGNLSDMKRHLKLRHHLQIDNVDLLNELSGAQGGSEMEGGETQLVLQASSDAYQPDGSPINSVSIGIQQAKQFVPNSQIQIVEMPNASSSNETIVETEHSLEGLHYTVTPGDDGKNNTAANILQQIIDISQQGTLENQHEITVKSEDGHSFIVQHEGEVIVASEENDASNQYIIQYITPGGQQVDIASNNTPAEVMIPEQSVEQDLRMEDSGPEVLIPRDKYTMVVPMPSDSKPSNPNNGIDMNSTLVMQSANEVDLSEQLVLDYTSQQRVEAMNAGGISDEGVIVDSIDAGMISNNAGHVEG